MGRVDGKVALISGGARGMGAAHAQALVAEGARVIIGDIRDDEGKAVAETSVTWHTSCTWTSRTRRSGTRPSTRR